MGVRNNARRRLRRGRQLARANKLTVEMVALGRDACNAWVIHGGDFAAILRSRAAGADPQAERCVERERSKAHVAAQKFKDMRDKVKRRLASKRTQRRGVA